MSGRREPLHGPEEAPAGIGAAARREPLHAAGLQDGPGRPVPHREPLHGSELADGPQDGPADREPLHARPVPLPPAAAALLARVAGPAAVPRHREPLHECPDIRTHVRQELADAAHARILAETVHGAGTGRIRGLFAGPRAPETLAEADRAQELAELAEDVAARAAAAARLELEDDARAALHAPRLQAQDRHAVAILAEHGPVSLTGRPVHALQLADGRAFVLQHVDGRPQWRPTGPRPLIGCPTLAGPWQDEDGPEDVDEAQTITGPTWARSASARVELPAGSAQPLTMRAGPFALHVRPDPTLGPDTFRIVATSRPELADAPSCPRHGYPHALPCPDVDDDAPALAQDAPQHAHGCSAAHYPGTPCPVRPQRPQDVDEDRPELAAAAYRAARDAGRLVDVPSTPQDVPAALWDRIRARQRERSTAAAHERAQEAPQEAPQDVEHVPAGPITPGEAPQACSGRPGRPDAPPCTCQDDRHAHCARPACPEACHEAPAAALQPPDGPEDVDEDAGPFEDVDDLADAIRAAGTWTVHTYARTGEALPGPVHQPRAFVDAAAAARADIARAAALPDVLPQLPGRIGWPAPSAAARARFEDARRAYWQHGPGSQPLQAWPAPDERPGDREALHVAQVEAQTAHERVTAAARGCTCLTRQREDPPCPVAALADPWPTPWPVDASELHPAGTPDPHDLEA